MPYPAFNVTGPSKVALTTSTVAGISTFQISGLSTVEIANTSATVSVAVAFTPATTTTGVAAVAATDRVIPPMTIVYQNLPGGCSFVSAIALSSASVSVQFTPGNFLPQG